MSKKIKIKGKTEKLFKCSLCGCVFEAGSEEYTILSETNYDICLVTFCPQCSYRVLRMVRK